MSAKEKTTTTKSPVITGVRRRNPYSGMLPAKKAATAMHIHTSCLSKKEFSAENERMVTNPKSEMASALTKTNQSMCANARAPSPAARLRADILSEFLERGAEGRLNERNNVNSAGLYGKGIGPREYDGSRLARLKSLKRRRRRSKRIARGIKDDGDERNIGLRTDGAISCKSR